jgi:hypothetical protein
VSQIVEADLAHPGVAKRLLVAAAERRVVEDLAGVGMREDQVVVALEGRALVVPLELASDAIGGTDREPRRLLGVPQ